jgi:chromate reductase, NAD(P)H dehydrogenase (quinone)
VSIKVAMLVGSLRKESFNRKMAKTMAAMAPEGAQMNEISIGDLPWYSEDAENAPHKPPEWTRLRSEVGASDAVLFVTPEYNRSVPGVLKNALDVGSRPYGKSVWDKKPGAVISVANSAIGGFGANHHLRQTLVFLNVPCMQQPEAYIGNSSKLFDESGRLTDDSTREFVKKFVDAFFVWIRLNGVH